MRASRCIAIAAVVLQLCLLSPVATADSNGGSGSGLRLDGDAGLGLLLLPVVAVLAVPAVALIADGVNTVAWASGERHGDAWVAVGAVTGILTDFVGLYLASQSEGARRASVPVIGFGTVTVLLSIAAGLQPRAPEEPTRVAP